MLVTASAPREPGREDQLRVAAVNGSGGLLSRRPVLSVPIAPAHALPLDRTNVDERDVFDRLDPKALLAENALVRRRAEIALAKYLKRRGVLTADSSTKPSFPSTLRRPPGR
jgi:hypothetical protein